MNKQPANYNMEMAESMWLHYDQQLQRTDISIRRIRFLLQQQAYWEGEFVRAHAKAFPLASLLNNF